MVCHSERSEESHTESAPQQSFPNGSMCELFLNSPKERNGRILSMRKAHTNCASCYSPYEYNIVFLNLERFTIRKKLVRRNSEFLAGYPAFLEEPMAMRRFISLVTIRGSQYLAFPIRQTLSDESTKGQKSALMPLTFDPMLSWSRPEKDLSTKLKSLSLLESRSERRKQL